MDQKARYCMFCVSYSISLDCTKGNEVHESSSSTFTGDYEINKDHLHILVYIYLTESTRITEIDLKVYGTLTLLFALAHRPNFSRIGNEELTTEPALYHGNRVICSL